MKMQMRVAALVACVASIPTFAQAPDASKAVVVDKGKFSDVYPAVWFSPSTGEIMPLKNRSEIPPEDKYEIWIEPDDPEFGWNPDQKPTGVGFALVGKGPEVFANPAIPKNPKLKLQITQLMKETQGAEQLVFYCKAKTSECVIMITAMDSKEEIIRFQWRPMTVRPKPFRYGLRMRASASGTFFAHIAALSHSMRC
jgi:hypothetical protein